MYNFTIGIALINIHYLYAISNHNGWSNLRNFGWESGKFAYTQTCKFYTHVYNFTIGIALINIHYLYAIKS
jgi:hypothetical protein